MIFISGDCIGCCLHGGLQTFSVVCWGVFTQHIHTAALAEQCNVVLKETMGIHHFEFKHTTRAAAGEKNLVKVCGPEKRRMLEHSDLLMDIIHPVHNELRLKCENLLDKTKEMYESWSNPECTGDEALAIATAWMSSLIEVIGSSESGFPYSHCVTSHFPDMVREHCHEYGLSLAALSGEGLEASQGEFKQGLHQHSNRQKRRLSDSGRVTHGRIYQALSHSAMRQDGINKHGSAKLMRKHV